MIKKKSTHQEFSPSLFPFSEKNDPIHNFGEGITPEEAEGLHAVCSVCFGGVRFRFRKYSFQKIYIFQVIVKTPT